MNGASVVEWIVALGIGVILAEIARAVIHRRKMGADTAQVITAAATSLLQPLNERITLLTEDVVAARAELHATREELSRTRIELHAAREEVATLRAQIARA